MAELSEPEGEGAGEGPIAPSDFGRSVNPISIKGADCAHNFSPPPPSGFSDLPTALQTETFQQQRVSV